MSKRPSSSRWQRRQAVDPFVRRARAEAWRSRAVFKLIEMHRRDRLLRPGMTVIDLGSAPGGWSQFASSVVGPAGRVIATDLLEIEPIPGLTFIRGDIRDEFMLDEILHLAGPDGAGLVMSDMAPNISGNWSVDQPRAIHLVELALDLAEKALPTGGTLVTKAFQGEGFDEVLGQARQRFRQVRIRKPQASRTASREIYLVARGYGL
jgi:23S rRNA (uridine2552-2'-O)-methyltransferase